ncbi:MAG: O-succinylhomoserine sulfhydrylase [Alphaproteobacteria bacterium]|nr:O-succinylhomoserine sulfhydrylase [Alphaproteobacteria bacterium]
MSQNDPLADCRPETLAVRAGLARSQHAETSEALYLNSGFVFDSAEQADAAFSGDIDRYLYGRYANPTITMLEERLRVLEGAEVCRTTASGMAAVFASMACYLEAGDRIVAGATLFGSSLHILTKILPKWGVEVDLVPPADLDAWAKALATPAKLVFVETPTNPTLDIVDLAALSDLAHKAGAKVIVDNVVATPVLQRPLDLGCDVVVYSTTKHLDGQGRTLGGAVLCDAAFDKDHLQPFLRHTGPCLSPFNAWVVVKGLETLALRVREMSRTAATLAARLEQLPNVTRVAYPGLASHPSHGVAKAQMRDGLYGSVLSVEVAGGRAAAFAFLNALQIVDLSNNLGDAKSLSCHPCTTTHRVLTPEAREAAGITEGLVRISIGLEHVDDLWADLERAAAAADAAVRKAA